MARVFKWVAIVGASLIALLVIAGVVVRLYYTDARLTALVRAQLHQRVPLEVRIGEVQLRLLHGIVITDVVVGPPTADYKEDVLHVREIRLGYRLWPLLTRKVAVDEVAIIEPAVVLEMQNGKWNALAVADKFKGETPASAPASARAEEPSDPEPLGFEVDLSAFTLQSFQARVVSPDINATVDRIHARVSAVYSGDRANAAAHIYVGEDSAPSHIHYVVKDVGEGDLSLVFDVLADVRSLSEAAVKIRMHASDMSGTAVGFRLPPTPVDFTLEAEANVLTQKASIASMTFAVGKAVTVSLAAKAGDILSDIEVWLERFEANVDLKEAIALLPKDMVPVAARGRVVLSKTQLHARLSELKARSPFDLSAELALQNVGVRMDELDLDGLNGLMTVQIARASGVHVSGTVGVAAVTQPGIAVNGTQVKLDVTAPASALQQKLDTPLVARLDVTVPEITQAPMRKLSSTTLALRTVVYDMQGDHADATLDLGIAQASIDDPKLGYGSYPLSLQIQATRRTASLKLSKFSLVVADLIRFSLNGTVVQRPAGALDVDLNAVLTDLDLARLVRIAPSLKRKELEEMALAGTVDMTAGIKGRIPEDVATQLQKPVDVVLEQGTPFDLDLQLGWQNLALVSGDNTLSGLSGALSVQTHPKRVSLQLDTSVKSVSVKGESPSELNDVSFMLDASYAKSEARGVGTLRVGKLAQASTKTLLGTAIDFELAYAKGVELVFKRMTVAIPTLGTNVSLRARVDKPEEAYKTKAWASKTLAGLKADAALDITVALPEKKMKLLAVKGLALSGDVSFKMDVGLDASKMKIDGAMRATHLDVEDAGMLVSNVHGIFPFVQEVRWTEKGIKPVLSSDDILRDKPRIAYYADLRSYGRDDQGLRIDKVVYGKYEMKKLAVNGKVDRGKLLLDYFSMSFLSGDLEGQLAAQLGADKVFRLALGAKFSNLDLSVLSKTTPGPESQINGNMQLQLQWGEKYPREVDQTTFNITRVGSQMLSAFILALDPEKKNENFVKLREQIQTYRAYINLLRVGVIHNTVNVDIDIDTTTLLSLVGINLIDRAAARRLDIKPRLESALAPALDPSLGPLLGWTEKTP